MLRSSNPRLTISASIGRKSGRHPAWHRVLSWHIAQVVSVSRRLTEVTQTSVFAGGFRRVRPVCPRKENVGLAASHRGVVIAFALLAACCVAQPGMAPDSRACSLRIHRRGIPPSPPVSPSCRENVLYSFENLGLSPQFCKYSKQSGPEKLARLHSHAHVLVDFLRGPKWQSGLMDHLRRRRGDDKSTGRRKRLDFACH